MPKPLQYRSGSVIYFQGDPADKIYILQNGKVSLVYKDIETGADIKDAVQPGEFFGVKSALGKYTREENAVVLSDTTVMVFTVPEFEAFATANSRIIMKMLKVFSNQMRRVHKQVSKLMAKEEQPPDTGLYMVGEHYFKNKRFVQASYVFSRYLTYYPTGIYAAQASKNLELAEKYAPQSGRSKNIPAASPPPPPASQGTNSANAYTNAVNLVSQGRYQEAMIAFKTIADANADPEMTAKSSFEIGRCMLLLKKYDESIKYFTNLLTRFPKHPDILEVLFIMGQCNENLGRKDMASNFYKKLLSMNQDANNSTVVKAKSALASIGMGA